LRCALQICWQRFGQIVNDFLKDFLYENLNFLHDSENLNFLYENLRFSLCKILMIFSVIFSMIHKISHYKVQVSTGGATPASEFRETRWLGWQFLNCL